MTKDWLSKWALYSPQKIAVKEYETGRTKTYEALQYAANAVASLFQSQYNIQKGDRIAIVAENCIEYLVLIGVAQKTGCIIVPLNYRLAPLEVDYLLSDAQPSLVIWEEKFNDIVTPTEHFKKIPHHLPLQQLRPLVEEAQQTPFQHTEIQEDDPIFILYTSGTTGFPKGALYTHKMLFWNSVNTAISLIINTSSKTINCMPPFHTGGLNVLMTPFLHRGGYTCLTKNFDAAMVLEALEKEKATIFMGVPTMLKMIADDAHFNNANLSSLHYIIVGGEPMPIPLIETWHNKGIPIRQGYGMTEVGPNLTSLHQEDAIRKQGSIGRANFYVETKIVHPDGTPTAANEAGELLLKGPMVTTGYWQNPVATQKAIQNDWFHTGDMVKVDEEGYFYVVDRIKNMYISGGENVYPAEVERVLVGHPMIAEVAIIGIPNKKWGEVGKAFIVLKDEKKTLSVEDLKVFCTDKLSKFKIPKSVEIVRTLPKTASGKIDRKALNSISKA